MKKNILFVNFEDDDYFALIQKKIISIDKSKNKYFSFSSKKPYKDIYHIAHKSLLYKNLKNQSSFFFKNKSLKYNIGDLEKKLLESMIDRVNLRLLSTFEKKHYINLILLYWSDFFKKNKPNIIFFVSTPHFPWDYALYQLAKKQNIKFYIIGRPRIDDTLLIFSDLNNILTSSINNKVLQSSFSKKKIDYKNFFSSELTGYSKNKNRRNFVFSFKKFKNFIPIFLSWFSPVFDKNYYFDLNIIEFILYKIKRIIIKNRCKKWIKKNSIDRNKIKKNFIVFFMQYRPERTLLPEGGVFFDQISAIKKISKLLPKNYQILVKEHPRIFSDMFYKPEIRLVNFHKIQDYELIKKIPKVEFVDYDLNADELIQKSKIVTSVTSSLNWDALLSSKPSLSFSETWHSFCKSSPKFSNKDINKQKLFNLINKNKNYISKDLKSFCNLLSKKAIYGCPYGKLFLKKDKKYQNRSILELSKVLWKLI
jgi:hypothetical protein